MSNKKCFYFFLLFFCSGSLSGGFKGLFKKIFHKPYVELSLSVLANEPCYLAMLPININNIILGYIIKEDLEKLAEKEFLKDYELNKIRGVVESSCSSMPVLTHVACILPNKRQSGDVETIIEDFNIVDKYIIGHQKFKKIDSEERSRFLLKRIKSIHKTRLITLENSEKMSITNFTVSSDGTKIFVLANTEEKKKLFTFDFDNNENTNNSWQKKVTTIEDRQFKELRYFKNLDSLALLTDNNEVILKSLNNPNMNLLEKYFRSSFVCASLKNSN